MGRLVTHSAEIPKALGLDTVLGVQLFLRVPGFKNLQTESI